MSATMCLYKPLYNERFGSVDDLFTWREKDYNFYDFIIKKDKLLYLKGYRAYHRYKKKLNELEWNIFYDDKGNKIEYLAFEIVRYRQGWFFNRKFFYKKKPSTCICTSKRGMIDAMNKYLDFKDQYPQSRYFDDKHLAMEAYKTFIEGWQDGYLFEMSW